MKRHPSDPISLLFGALFTGVGLVLLGGDPRGGSLSLAWVGPAVAIAVAVLVVLATWPGRRAPSGGEDVPEA